jgi:flagellar hook-length control protein FliK
MAVADDIAEFVGSTPEASKVSDTHGGERTSSLPTQSKPTTSFVEGLGLLASPVAKPPEIEETGAIKIVGQDVLPAKGPLNRIPGPNSATSGISVPETIEAKPGGAAISIRSSGDAQLQDEGRIPGERRALLKTDGLPLDKVKPSPPILPKTEAQAPLIRHSQEDVAGKPPTEPASEITLGKRGAPSALPEAGQVVEPANRPQTPAPAQPRKQISQVPGAQVSKAATPVEAMALPPEIRSTAVTEDATQVSSGEPPLRLSMPVEKSSRRERAFAGGGEYAPATQAAAGQSASGGQSQAAIQPAKLMPQPQIVHSQRPEQFAVLDVMTPVTSGEPPEAILSLNAAADDVQKRVAEPDLRSPALARGASRQIVDSIRLPIDGSIEQRLSPQELGRVKLSMVPGEAGMVIQIAAERAETLELLRRHADILAEDLQSAGIEGLDFSFSQDAENDHHDDRPQFGALASSDPDLQENSGQPVAMTSRRVGEAGIDIRL